MRTSRTCGRSGAVALPQHSLVEHAEDSILRAGAEASSEDACGHEGRCGAEHGGGPQVERLFRDYVRREEQRLKDLGDLGPERLRGACAVPQSSYGSWTSRPASIQQMGVAHPAAHAKLQANRLAGAQAGARAENSLQIGIIETVTKTVACRGRSEQGAFCPLYPRSASWHKPEPRRPRRSTP
jgi:hypothetical protein